MESPFSAADLERKIARLIVTAYERGDDFWLDKLQIDFDLTLAEARELLK